MTMFRRPFARARPVVAAADDGVAETIRVEYIALGLTLLSLVARASVMGPSMAMFAAIMEDVTELVGPVAILFTLYLERRPHNPRHPFGYQRIGSLSFFGAAVSLLILGLLVIYQAVQRLLQGTAPPFGDITVLGWTFWQGWLMVGVVLATNAIMVPVIQAKRGLGERVRLAALTTDTHANISHVAIGTGAAFGIVLTRFGWWWADPLVALSIGAVILADGVQHLVAAARELIDVAPDQETMAALSGVVAAKPYIRQHYWLARKVGRFIDADLLIACDATDVATIDRWRSELEIELRAANWQLHDLVIAFGQELPTGKEDDWVQLIPNGSSRAQSERRT